MSVLAALGVAVGRRGEREPDCRPCRHFTDEAPRVEDALPGIAIFSSTQSSAWAQSGLCLRHERVTNGKRRCAAFALG